MNRGKPFVVINCLSQGFAVAGPCECGVRNAECGIDLEMVVWGQSREQAIAMAADLNADPELKHRKD